MTGSLVTAPQNRPPGAPSWQRLGRYDHRVAYDEDLATRIRDLIALSPS